MSNVYPYYGYKGSLGNLPTEVGQNIPFYYVVEVPPVGNVLTLEEVKAHLRITNDDNDTYLTFLIKSAEHFAQEYMRLTFLETTFKTFRDFFYPTFTLKRAPFISVESIEYLKKGTFTLISDSVYSVILSKVYSSVYLRRDQNWPQDNDDDFQSIRILFKAGFGTASDVPDDIKLAILNHIAFLYGDRGDCDECACKTNLPSQSQLVYNMYKVRDVGITSQLG